MHRGIAKQLRLVVSNWRQANTAQSLLKSDMRCREPQILFAAYENQKNHMSN